MESRLLEIFVQVVELGSFSKVAQTLQITPSAVIQQFNRLEDDLGVRLLVRTKKGVVLTPAGKHMLRESKKLLREIQRIEDSLREFRRENDRTITLGSSLVRKSRVFYPLWRRFAAGLDWNVQTFNVSDIQRTWQQVDIIECAHYGGAWQNSMRFTELCSIPVVLAASAHVLPAAQETVSWEDLRGKTLVSSNSGLSPSFDRIAAEARSRGIQVIEVPRYDMSLFTLCEVNGYLLLMPLCWHDLYPAMRTLRCDWDYTLPYGFFCQQQSPAIIDEFLAFVTRERDTLPLCFEDE